MITAGEAAGLPEAYLRSVAGWRRLGTRGAPFVDVPAPRGPVAGVRPRFTTPHERR